MHNVTRTLHRRTSIKHWQSYTHRNQVRSLTFGKLPKFRWHLQIFSNATVHGKRSLANVRSGAVVVPRRWTKVQIVLVPFAGCDIIPETATANRLGQIHQSHETGSQKFPAQRNMVHSEQFCIVPGEWCEIEVETTTSTGVTKETLEKKPRICVESCWWIVTVVYEFFRVNLSTSNQNTPFECLQRSIVCPHL